MRASGTLGTEGRGFSLAQRLPSVGGRMRTVAGVFVALSLFAVVPRGASACSCVILPGSCSAFGEGDAMFEATVVAIERREHPSPQPNVMFQERVVHLADVRA